MQGFRSKASTLLLELGLTHAVIERRKMMQQWADYLDKLKTGADVISLLGQAA